MGRISRLACNVAAGAALAIQLFGVQPTNAEDLNYSTRLLGKDVQIVLTETGDQACHIGLELYKNDIVSSLEACGRNVVDKSDSIYFLELHWLRAQFVLPGNSTGPRVNVCHGGAEYQMRRLVPLEQLDVADKVSKPDKVRVILDRYLGTMIYQAQTRHVVTDGMPAFLKSTVDDFCAAERKALQ